ncbi:putative transmembrane domain containing protein [Providencia phage EPr2]|uniref:Transmembrane domain containing protein n=1 Tax=Providencia phage EPr2 TaxID=2917333 RepID=A0AC61TSW7_9CAUD|nr:putative transmembrane domain containing protein [Providencia phage EPr2]
MVVETIGWDYWLSLSLLLAAGVTAGSQWVGWVETLVCSLVSQCN